MAKEIAAGRVQSDQRELKPSSLVRTGEIFDITIPGIAPNSAPPPLPDIVYEDERLIILNKPPHLLCHPAGDRWEWGIIGLVRDYLPGVRIELAHRLDRETSGILVLTKDLAANIYLKERLRRRTEDLKKEYLAIVRGQPKWTENIVEAPIDLDVHSQVRLRRGVVAGGLSAKTGFEVREHLGEFTVVKCHLFTGRTHQIRIHLNHLGFPILGDKIYGQPDRVFMEWMQHRDVSTLHPGIDNQHFVFVRNAVGFSRQALHAWRMQLPHPDGHILNVEAPIPSDMKSIIDGLSPSWPGPETCPSTTDRPI